MDAESALSTFRPSASFKLELEFICISLGRGSLSEALGRIDPDSGLATVTRESPVGARFLDRDFCQCGVRPSLFEAWLLGLLATLEFDCRRRLEFDGTERGVDDIGHKSSSERVVEEK